MISINDWRNDPQLKSMTCYKKRFAFFPVKCIDGTVVWMKSFYKKYQKWYYKSFNENDPDLHTDFLGNITQDEYIIIKLTE